MSRSAISALIPLALTICCCVQAFGQSKVPAKSIKVLKAEFKQRQAERRQSLLKDESDLGLGMTIRKYRRYAPASDLSKRREVLGLTPNNWASGTLFQIPYGFGQGSGTGFEALKDPFGANSSIGRISIYQWQAPVVGNKNGKSFIIPGGFAAPGH